jgi:hypothetical protein
MAFHRQSADLLESLRGFREWRIEPGSGADAYATESSTSSSTPFVPNPGNTLGAERPRFWPWDPP